VEVRSFPVAWNGRPARFFLVRDLSPAPTHEREPELVAKLDLTGRVSGSIAHDFNNLLTVILAVAEQLQEGEGDPEQQVSLIAKTVRNAQELAQQRLSLGGSQMVQRERLDLNAVIDEQKEVLGVLLGKKIELSMDFDKELGPVFADAGQWREVVLNLAVNARDAMPEGGELSISTTRAVLAADDSELGLPRGLYVQLVVQDTGQGMTEETRSHAFKPYFSTKSRSTNSGLGLASVLAAVQQSGGGIRLTSSPGEGARFDIFIPAQSEEAPAAPPGGLVLLVEDSSELRKMIQGFLTARGYEVIACGSAEAALKWSRTLIRKLDLVICDLILPDLPGDMLVEQIGAQHPGTKVLFMSGQPYAVSAMRSSETVTAKAVCLEKPFSLHQLANTVAEILGNPVPSNGS
jgi:two-component system, cell cycle sensor histidine kinase and response regulator CckA